MKRLYASFFAVVLLLAGCATTDVRERVSQVELANQGVIALAIELREAGVIERGSELETRVTDILTTADVLMDQASAAAKDDQLSEARDALSVALRMLLSLSAELEAMR